MIDSADAAFLRTILSVPDEDTPRLVYSDYLEENGRVERAEFIRLQCELANTPNFVPRHASLKAHEQELLARFEVEWKNHLPMLQGIHWEAFERGFVTAVRFDDPHTFFTHASEIFEATPIQRLSLHGFSEPETRRLAQVRSLSKVRILDLKDGNEIGNGGLEALAASPHLLQLRELQLSRNKISTAGVRALVNSPIVEKLQILDLDRNEIFDDGARLLAESPHLKNLGYLYLDWTRAGTEGAITLAQSPHLTKLHSLYLSGNEIGDDGAIAFVEASHHAKLQALYLANNRIGNAGAIALAASVILDHAHYLSLRNNQIGDSGARALATSPYLGDVRELILGDNLISDEAGEVLRERFGKRVWLW